MTDVARSALRLTAVLSLAGALVLTASLVVAPEFASPPAQGALVFALFVLVAGAAIYPLLARDHDRLTAATKEARAAGQRLSVLLDHAPAILWTVDRDLRFTSSRGKGLAGLGLTENQVVGMPLEEFFDTDDPDFLPIRSHRSALAGEAHEYDFEWQGRLFRVAIEPQRHDDDIVGVVGAAFDVTEWRETQRQLEEQKAHLQLLFDSAPEAIVVVDENDRVLEVNAEFERTFGYAPDEVVGRTVNALIVPADRMADAEALTQRVASGERLEAQAVRQRKDGSLLDVSILATPLDIESKRRVYCLYRDITEQKNLESQLLHSQRLEAVGQLAGGVAHDFNNILTAILGQVRILVDGPLEDPVREALEEIETAAERAADVTRQLLRFSRRDVVARRPVDLNGVVSGMEDLLQRLIGDHVELVTDLPEESLVLSGDPSQLQQVVMNLVINARDAMPGGGTVVVRTGRWLPPEGGPGVPHGTAFGGDLVLLQVEDDGCGMTPEEKARIFEPFFTTKDRSQGTGLGLSTVYGIVDQSGGSVEVESEEGVGTTVRILLPSTDDRVEPRIERRTVEAPSGRGETVLLVDDDRPVRAVTRRILEKQGYRVLTADCGESALELAASLEEPPDLLLTDIVMPRISGFELADRLIGRWPTTRRLFMSGYTESQRTGSRDRPEEVREILNKPFDVETLARRVREALEER